MTLHNPMDMHTHLRDGELMQVVAPYTARCFSAGLVMPNLVPPLLKTQNVNEYKAKILQCTKNFEPIMSLYLSEELTKNDLIEARNEGIKIIKFYPRGATTNSSKGIKNIDKKLMEVLDVAQGDFILCVHCESEGFVLDREREFHATLERLVREFPRLKIVVEHISDHKTIELIHKHENLFGTITVHHMLLTLDDVIGGKLMHNNFCKPVAKTRKDRDAILQTALNADRKFSFGSDSAPHTINDKTKGAAGVFSAPILLELLTDIFTEHGSDNLQSFVSNNACRIYDITPKYKKTIKLKQEDHIIPKHITTPNGVIEVFFAGQVLHHKIELIDEF